MTLGLSDQALILNAAKYFFAAADKVRELKMQQIAQRPAPEKSISDVIQSCNQDKQANLFDNNFKVDRAKAVERITEIAKSWGIKKFDLLSDKGANAFVLRTDRGTVLRICGNKVTIGKSEPKRASIGAVVQPINEIVLNADAEEIVYEENDTTYIFMEELNEEPVSTQDVFSYLEIDGSELPIEIMRPIIHNLYLASIDDTHIDTDPGSDNIIVTSDHQLRNIDSGAVVARQSLKERKIEKLLAIQSEDGLTPETLGIYRDCLAILSVSNDFASNDLVKKETPVVPMARFQPTGTDGPT